MKTKVEHINQQLLEALKEASTFMVHIADTKISHGQVKIHLKDLEKRIEKAEKAIQHAEGGEGE